MRRSIVREKLTREGRVWTYYWLHDTQGKTCHTLRNCGDRWQHVRGDSTRLSVWRDVSAEYGEDKVRMWVP